MLVVGLKRWPGGGCTLFREEDTGLGRLTPHAIARNGYLIERKHTMHLQGRLSIEVV